MAVEAWLKCGQWRKTVLEFRIRHRSWLGLRELKKGEMKAVSIGGKSKYEGQEVGSCSASWEIFTRPVILDYSKWKGLVREKISLSFSNSQGNSFQYLKMFHLIRCANLGNLLRRKRREKIEISKKILADFCACSIKALENYNSACLISTQSFTS